MAYYTYKLKADEHLTHMNVFTKDDNDEYFLPDTATHTLVSITIQNISLFNIHRVSALLAQLFFPSAA